MFPYGVTPKSSTSPSWSQTIISSASQLYGYLTSAGDTAMPHIDGSGNEKAPTARSARRQGHRIAAKHEKESARQPATRTEPMLIAVLRVVSQWAPSLPGPMLVSGATTKPAVLLDPEYTSFIRIVSDDFQINDLDQGAPLAGRPIIFLAHELSDPVERTMMGEAVHKLALGMNDILLAELLSYHPNGEYTVDCFGLGLTTVCNAFGVPQVLADNHDFISRHSAAMTEHVQWLEAQGESTGLSGHSVDTSKSMKTLHAAGERLKARNHHNDALHAEIDKRYSDLSKSNRKVRALERRNQSSLSSEALIAIKGSLKADARLVVVIRKPLADAMASELAPLRPVLLERKPDRQQQRRARADNHDYL